MSPSSAWRLPTSTFVWRRGPRMTASAVHRYVSWQIFICLQKKTPISANALGRVQIEVDKTVTLWYVLSCSANLSLNRHRTCLNFQKSSSQIVRDFTNFVLGVQRDESDRGKKRPFRQEVFVWEGITHPGIDQKEQKLGRFSKVGRKREHFLDYRQVIN